MTFIHPHFFFIFLSDKKDVNVIINCGEYGNMSVIFRVLNDLIKKKIRNFSCDVISGDICFNKLMIFL